MACDNNQKTEWNGVEGVFGGGGGGGDFGISSTLKCQYNVDLLTAYRNTHLKHKTVSHTHTNAQHTHDPRARTLP